MLATTAPVLLVRGRSHCIDQAASEKAGCGSYSKAIIVVDLQGLKVMTHTDMWALTPIRESALYQSIDRVLAISLEIQPRQEFAKSVPMVVPKR